MNRAEQLEKIFSELYEFVPLHSESPQISKINQTKKKMYQLLEQPFQKRIASLEIFNNDGSINWTTMKIITAIYNDQMYKYTNIPKTREDIETHKLLKARECDDGFELNLAKMIVGDNENFPYRSSYYITQFFHNLGYNETHDGSTRRIWVENLLKCYPITDIYNIVTKGLFKKRYFIDTNKDIDTAINDFKKMLQYCYSANEVCDISSAFDLNLNTELLFSNQIESPDKTLNDLIEDSRDKLIKGDRQGAVEKIWDALERSKTILNEDKKKGIKALCELCASDLDSELFNNEFGALTNIGNDYQIRHFETTKKVINDDDTLKYLYFRAFALVNYAVRKLNSQQENNVEVLND